jgi:hypothetical protein
MQQGMFDVIVTLTLSKFPVITNLSLVPHQLVFFTIPPVNKNNFTIQLKHLSSNKTSYSAQLESNFGTL